MEVTVAKDSKVLGFDQERFAKLDGGIRQLKDIEVREIVFVHPDAVVFNKRSQDQENAVYGVYLDTTKLCSLEDGAPKLLVERTSSDRCGYRVIFREETDYNTLIRVNSLSEYPNFGGKVENLAYIDNQEVPRKLLEQFRNIKRDTVAAAQVTAVPISAVVEKVVAEVATTVEPIVDETVAAAATAVVAEPIVMESMIVFRTSDFQPREAKPVVKRNVRGEATWKKIDALRNAGTLNVNKIAAQVGITTETVYYHLNKQRKASEVKQKDGNESKSSVNEEPKTNQQSENGQKNSVEKDSTSMKGEKIILRGKSEEEKRIIKGDWKKKVKEYTDEGKINALYISGMTKIPYYAVKDIMKADGITLKRGGYGSVKMPGTHEPVSEKRPIVRAPEILPPVQAKEVKIREEKSISSLAEARFQDRLLRLVKRQDHGDAEGLGLVIIAESSVASEGKAILDNYNKKSIPKALAVSIYELSMEYRAKEKLATADALHGLLAGLNDINDLNMELYMTKMTDGVSNTTLVPEAGKILWHKIANDVAANMRHPENDLGRTFRRMVQSKRGADGKVSVGEDRKSLNKLLEKVDTFLEQWAF